MKKFILISGFVLWIGGAYPQNNFSMISESELAVVKNNIKERNKQIQTLSCPFTQTKKMAVLKENAVTKGMMYFKKINKFRWEYTGENPFIFVQNGEKYYTKANGKATEIKDGSARLFQEISQLVIASISGDILENTRKFRIQFSQNNSVVWVRLTPVSKSMQSFMSQINLFFSKDTYLATKIEIHEKGGDMTLIQFDNVKVNQPIDDNLFELK